MGTLGGAAKLNHTVFKSITHEDARPLLFDAVTATVVLLSLFSLVAVAGCAVDVVGCCVSLLPALWTESHDLNENLIFSFALASLSFIFASKLDGRGVFGVFGVVGFFKLLLGSKFSVVFAAVESSFPVFSIFITCSRLVAESTTVFMLSSLFSDFSNCELQISKARSSIISLFTHHNVDIEKTSNYRLTIFVRIPSSPHSNIMKPNTFTSFVDSSGNLIQSNMAWLLCDGMAVMMICPSWRTTPSFFKRLSCACAFEMSHVMTNSSCCFSDVSINMVDSPGILSLRVWDDRWAENKMNTFFDEISFQFRKWFSFETYTKVPVFLS